MCQECNQPPEQPRSSPASFTRRFFLALAATGAGAASVALWSCREEMKAAHPRGTLPATTRVPAATVSNTEASTLSSQPATPTAAAEPTPDLGSVLFPDANNRPLALAADAPVIVIPRRDWTSARPHFNQIHPMNGIERLTVHHTASDMNTDAWRPTTTELEDIREFHAGTRPKDRHWADIAYHFAVDRAGRVWQARPLAYQGAHVKGHNEHNLGIVVLGNFEIEFPSAAQLVSLRDFIGFVRRLYSIPLAQVFTHGELGMTSCPGKHLQAYMNRARRQWALAEGVSWSPARCLPGVAPSGG